MMTSEKLFVVLERSSVELLEEGLRFWSCPLAGRAGLEGTGGGERWLLAVEEEGGSVTIQYCPPPLPRFLLPHGATTEKVGLNH